MQFKYTDIIWCSSFGVEQFQKNVFYHLGLCACWIYPNRWYEKNICIFLYNIYIWPWSLSAGICCRNGWCNVCMICKGLAWASLYTGKWYSIRGRKYFFFSMTECSCEKADLRSNLTESGHQEKCWDIFRALLRCCWSSYQTPKILRAPVEVASSVQPLSLNHRACVRCMFCLCLACNKTVENSHFPSIGPNKGFVFYYFSFYYRQCFIFGFLGVKYSACIVYVVYNLAF